MSTATITLKIALYQPLPAQRMSIAKILISRR